MKIFSFLFLLSISGCDLFNFGPEYENLIPDNLIPQYEIDDLIFFKNQKNEADTFRIISSKNFYDFEGDHEVLTFTLSSLNQTVSEIRWLGIDLYADPAYIVIQTLNPDRVEFYTKDIAFSTITLNGLKYDSVYTGKSLKWRDSSAVIDSIYYQGRLGILSYSYLDGEKFFLDTIIK